MLIFERLEESYHHLEPIDWQSAKLSIEHIMPQSLTEEWRKALAADGEDPNGIHEELLHVLGNLTITAYNGKLSNHPFERKQADPSGKPSGVKSHDHTRWPVGPGGDPREV